jgi:hypothetical protein
VSQAVKKWCDRDLADEQESAGEVDWQSFVNRKACLKLEPGAVKNGKQFENIAEILEVCEDEEVTICEPQENS